MIQNLIVLLLVAAAVVYMVVRLRQMAGGESKCGCGSQSCGTAPSCGGATNAGGQGQLPLLAPPCGQAGCVERESS
jgi:hypothetical protein